MRLILVLLLSLASLLADVKSMNGSDYIAKVIKFDGIVKSLKDGALKKLQVEEGEHLNPGDIVMTYRHASVMLELINGSRIVLDEKAILRFAQSDMIQQRGGAIYYEITKRDAKNSLKVRTPFAIIGIKGTTFIINADDNPNIALKEGIVNIKSIKDKFELYRERAQKKVDNYRAKEQHKVDEYRKEQAEALKAYKASQERYIKEYRASFELHSGRSVSFNKQRAEETPMRDQDTKQFEYFEALIQSF